MKRYILIIFILLFAGGIANIHAAGANSASRAAAYYNKGDYAKAIEIYDSIIKSDGASAQLLFNMGNAYVRLNKLGEGMVCYQKAQARQPSNNIIRENINYITDKISDRNKAKLEGKNVNVMPDDLTGLNMIGHRIWSRVSPSLWGWLAIAAFLIMIVGVSFYLFSQNVKLRKVGFFGGIVCLVLTVVLNVFTFLGRDYWLHRNECVIMSYEATLLPEPDKKAKPQVTPLVSGTVLQVIERDVYDSPGWVKVRLNSNFIGYLPKSEIVEL